MGNGASLPYALRHNKFVDRRVFIDLLFRISRWKPLDDHVYISMGGNSLEDHKLIYSQLGLSRLVSIDELEHVVRRQEFNKPTSTMKCIERTTKDFSAAFRSELKKLELPEEANVIVWFDYTKPSGLLEQLTEFVELLNSMSEGDIVRITINAHPPSLVDARSLPPEQRTPEFLAEARKEALLKRLGQYAPETLAAEKMTADGLPVVIAEAFRTAALDAFPAEDPQTFLPLSAIRYSDGQQMLSLTGVIVTKGGEKAFQSVTKIEDWSFFSASWTEVKAVAIPELTLRERLFLDQVPYGKAIDKVAEELGFLFDGKLDTTENVVHQYKESSRFYPHFAYVPT